MTETRGAAIGLANVCRSRDLAVEETGEARCSGASAVRAVHHAAGAQQRVGLRVVGL